MIGRIFWFMGLAAAGLLIGALQLDMRARSASAVAPAVPELFRDHAQVQITRKALTGTDAARALVEAERLVQRRPLPAENLTLLAAAQAKAGQVDAAARTIQVAGQRGWRDPVAQEAMMRLALAAGDRPEAARRYAALFLRGRTPDALLLEFGPAVFDGQDRSGRDTLVAIVIGGERWHPTFLRRGAKVMPPAAFAAIAADSMARGTVFDCKTLAISISELARRDKDAAAKLRAAGQASCPALEG
jgi:hypothetical protein